MNFTRIIIVLVAFLIASMTAMAVFFPDKIEAIYQDFKGIGAHEIESRPDMKDDLSDLKDYLKDFSEDRDKIKDSD